jgi:DNA-binding response OmpR family regulator
VPDSRTKRVFVMDDSAFALELTRTALAEAGITAVCARDLQDLQQVGEAEPDLVLMDVEMPEAFGDDIATLLMGEGKAPVYLLSSLPGDELERRARECGAAGYIEKRLGIAGVIACVRSILGVDSSPATDVPQGMIAELLSAAGGRIRRAEGAVARGEPGHAGSELHTLAGEAALLGLAEVARAAAACRAVVGSDEGRGGGPVFEAAIESLRVQLDGAARAAHVTRPARAAGRGRVLLLDDSELYRSVLMGMLEDAGFEVVEARRLAEARHRMRAGHYDLAILDVQLEDGLGHELISELRRHAPTTRIVMLSADDATTHGADRALSKLLPPDELLRAITALVVR